MIKKNRYLLTLKKNLALIAREQYDDSPGGQTAVEHYNIFCIQLKKAKSVGQVIRVAHTMDVDLREVMFRMIKPMIEDLDRTDLVHAPEVWDA